jgi:pimeloyl-ACP methyl ester carboxylesterase
VVAALTAAACGGSGNAGTPGSVPVESTMAVDTTVPTGSDITWTPCGQVQCGSLDVPALHTDPAGPTLRIALYRRAATAGASRGTLLLLPDFDGPSARQLAEQATVMVGPAARSFDVVAVSPRGFFDSSALPCGTKTEWVADAERAAAIAVACALDRGDTATSLGLLDSADDVERVIGALDARRVKAVGWGRGATILAAWKMRNPDSSSFLVLDSPDDPGIAPSRAAGLNRTAEDAALAATMLWCTSHISCSLVDNAAKRVGFVLDDIEGGVAGPVTESHFRLAFTRAMATADIGGLFAAFAAAEKGDFAPLAGFAAVDGSADGARFAARVAAACSDLSREEARKIAAADAAFETLLFRVGLGATIPMVCASMPEPARPLSPLEPAAAARGATVRVFVAAGDPATSPAMVRAFAKRLDWEFSQVEASGHLVVGRDRAVTDAVSRFLTGE